MQATAAWRDLADIDDGRPIRRRDVTDVGDPVAHDDLAPADAIEVADDPDALADAAHKSLSYRRIFEKVSICAALAGVNRLPTPSSYGRVSERRCNMSKPAVRHVFCRAYRGNGATAPGSYDPHDLDQSFAMLADHGGARRRRIAAECFRRQSGSRWIGSMKGTQSPFLVGVDKGYFKSEGLDVTIDTAGGSVEPINRIASGNYQMAFADINSLIKFRDQNRASR